MKGAKSKPVQELVAKGTYRKDRHGKPTIKPEPAETLPAPPPTLPAQCRKDWDRVCGLLDQNGILTDCDLDMVARYCFLLDMERRATAALSEAGPTIRSQTKHGDIHKPNPAFRVLMETAKELRAIGESLGFDPYSRQRINLSPKREKDDPFAFLFEKIDARRGAQ